MPLCKKYLCWWNGYTFSVYSILNYDVIGRSWAPLILNLDNLRSGDPSSIFILKGTELHRGQKIEGVACRTGAIFLRFPGEHEADVEAGHARQGKASLQAWLACITGVLCEVWLPFCANLKASVRRETRGGRLCLAWLIMRLLCRLGEGALFPVARGERSKSSSCSLETREYLK